MVNQNKIVPFNRSSFLNTDKRITYIGTGSMGGKAQGLVDISEVLQSDLHLIHETLKIQRVQYMNHMSLML